MFAHTKAWEASGQRRDEFCKSRGISLPSFGYWRTRYLRKQGKQQEAKTIVDLQEKMLI